jgi:hypothetical protein
MMKDDIELFKQFSDNEGFRRWLTDTVFDLRQLGCRARPGITVKEAASLHRKTARSIISGDAARIEAG